jgi:hypothetical protein
MSSSEEEEFDGNLEEGEVDEGEDDDNNDDNEVNDGSDVEDETLASLVNRNGKDIPRKRAAANISKSYGEDEDEDEDESDSADDVPLSSLVPRKETNNHSKGTTKNGTTKSPNGAADKKKKASPKKKATVAKKVKKNDNIKSKTTTTTTSSSSTSGKKNYEWVSTAVYGTECEKGLLIQRLLCRWWYAYEWPDPNILPKKTPKNHDTLDGFPGVYICTAGESVGKLKDVRNHDDCPSFLNFLTKPSSELKDLLLKALKEQTKVLVEKEGNGTATEKQLTKLMQWATKLNPDKADREIQKVLKAHKFTKYL